MTDVEWAEHLGRRFLNSMDEWEASDKSLPVWHYMGLTELEFNKFVDGGWLPLRLIRPPS